MGQLFNRISRLVKSELKDTPSNIDLENMNNDDDLKKIIDELNNSASKPKNENFGSKPKNSESQNKSYDYNTGRMNRQTAFSILGINEGDSIEQIKSKYKIRIKEYHPDKAASLGEEIKQLASKKTIEINAAYEYLKTEMKF